MTVGPPSGSPDPFGAAPPAPPGPYHPPASGPPAAGVLPGQPSGSATTSTVVDDTRPEPGELRLTGRRAWKSWHVAVFVVAACLLGMWFAWDINGSAGSAASGKAGSSTYRLPTQSSGSGGSSGSTGSSGAGTGSGVAGADKAGGKGSATTTTVAGGASGSTTTTVAGGAGGAGGATATTQPLGQEAYLVPAHQASGNWTSPAFNIAGSTWYIGWAFQCNPVPAATPTFAVYVVASGATPSGSPAVTSAAAQGQSVTDLTSTGSQQLVVQAPPQCEWVVKVTGYGGS